MEGSEVNKGFGTPVGLGFSLKPFSQLVFSFALACLRLIPHVLHNI